MARALQAPIRQIADNAGVEGSIVVGKVLENRSASFGYDAQKEEAVEIALRTQQILAEECGVTETAEGYQVYDPERYTEDSTRGAIDFVDNLASLKFQHAIEDIRAKREPFEQAMFDRQAEIEKEALALYEDDPQAARQYLTDYSNGLMAQATKMYIGLRNELIVNYTNNQE